MASPADVTHYDELDQAVLAAMRLSPTAWFGTTPIADAFVKLGLKEHAPHTLKHHALLRACDLLAKLWWDGEVTAVIGEATTRFITPAPGGSVMRQRRHYELRLGKISFHNDTMIDIALAQNKPKLSPFKPERGACRMSRAQRKAEAKMIVVPAGADRSAYEASVRAGSSWRRVPQ